MGRESGFNFGIPAGVEDQTTFLLSEPGIDVPATSPLVEHSVAEAVADEAQERDADPTVQDYEDYGPELAEADDHSDLDDEIELEENLIGPEQAKSKTKPRKKQKRISQHGIEYPSLPPAFVKKVAQTALQTSGLSNSRISADTLAALTQASEWFFEQLGDDLGAYAGHAKRKTIEESDVVTLMRRYVISSWVSTLYFLDPYSNIVQATSSRVYRHTLLPRPEAPPARTPSRAENAHTTTGKTTSREAAT